MNKIINMKNIIYWMTKNYDINLINYYGGVK